MERVVEDLENELRLEQQNNQKVDRSGRGNGKLIVPPVSKEEKKIKEKLDAISVNNFTSDIWPYTFSAAKVVAKSTPKEMHDSLKVKSKPVQRFELAFKNLYEPFEEKV